MADAAATFCVEHGFDDVTAEQLAHGIGISRATFFRYFTSKEDAVVLAARGAAARAGSFAESVAEATEAATPGTRAWEVLHAATAPMVTTAETRGDPLRARIRMITEVPALKAYLASQRASDQSAVADVLRARLRDDRSADILAAAGVTAVDLAWQEWARTPTANLRPLLDAYFEAFGDVTAPTLT
ncbi:TetR family transcriptional regulator [Tsukamurella sp. PLM1]|uniref:TetR family transcriptional regulator n=1 Tax=Tsukamurella sp. PLM1 TaxID=2929795 RepID=UPI0020C040DA|nr:TetR family transcriptional regulator [Tsukamurella sp. PLM1]